MDVPFKLPCPATSLITASSLIFDIQTPTTVTVSQEFGRTYHRSPRNQLTSGIRKCWNLETTKNRWFRVDEILRKEQTLKTLDNQSLMLLFELIISSKSSDLHSIFYFRDFPILRSRSMVTKVDSYYYNNLDWMPTSLINLLWDLVV